jgi:hypothetical protein
MDASRQCPDFCKGIAGHLEIACVSGLCVQRARPAPCTEASDYRRCERDADCACGVNTASRSCDFGRAECIDSTTQCPDFCTGWGQRLMCRDGACALAMGG